jgi:hypothetical protein
MIAILTATWQCPHYCDKSDATFIINCVMLQRRNSLQTIFLAVQSGVGLTEYRCTVDDIQPRSNRGIVYNFVRPVLSFFTKGSLIFCAGREIVIRKFEIFFHLLWPACNLISMFDWLVEAGLELIKSNQIDITLEHRLDVLRSNAIITIMDKGKPMLCRSIPGINLPCRRFNDTNVNTRQALQVASFIYAASVPVIRIHSSS